MKNVHQSLVDYEVALLKAIAERHALQPATSDQAELIAQVAEALLSPATIAITLDHLTDAEHDALQFVLQHGGQVEAPRFMRQFGTIRPMGPARLEREQPWQNPANPAEGLWYRGLIYKAFHLTEQGSQEMIYIPVDLMPLLTTTAPDIEPVEEVQLSQASFPSHTLSTEGRLRENIFSLLVYLQTTPVKVQNKDEIPSAAKQALTKCLLPSFLPSFKLVDELEFLLHLARRVKLLTVAHGRLKPERDATRSWLQADPPQQVQLLQNGWRADPTWNDLWHVPGLVPQPTGWENSPLKARAAILGHLEQLQAEPGAWFSIEEFVQMIKNLDPDFQRPNGDYESWYIKDAEGTMLMGFDHWDDVEGNLIRYLLTAILPLLGVVELGGASETGPPTAFSLTPPGLAFLTNSPIQSDSPTRPSLMRIDAKFGVRVPAHISLYDRFQLARFAELEQREANRTIYRITQNSIGRAIKNGVTVDQIMAFLTRVTNSQIPLNVMEAVRIWGTRYATVSMEQAMLLRVQDQKMITELRQHPKLGHLLGEVIGPTTILVPTDNIPEVRRLLDEMGYLAL